MRIGIISKEAHAKAVVMALSNNGHEIIMLGGGPVSLIPPTVEALICRTVSCSHGAMDFALAIKRAGKIPVIFEAGVTRILEEIDKLNGKSVVASSIAEATTSVAAPIALPPVTVITPPAPPVKVLWREPLYHVSTPSLVSLAHKKLGWLSSRMATLNISRG